MNALLPLLASAAVGGVIGYSTNWVAIKMLFRPLEEKRIAGIRVPFTPGVVPRQRLALGTSIGNAVDDYLFTPDALLETVESATFKHNIATFIEQQSLVLGTSTTTIELLASDFTFIAQPENVCELILKALGGLNLEKSQLNLLLLPLAESISNIPFADFTRLWDLKLQEPVVTAITELANNKLSQMIANQTPLNELLPAELTDYLASALHNQAPNINAWLIEQCDSVELRELLETYIAGFMSGNMLGTILGGFLPPASLTKTICEQVKEKLGEEDALSLIEVKLKQTFDQLLEMNPEQLLLIPPVLSNTQINKILDMLIPLGNTPANNKKLSDFWDSSLGLSNDLVDIMGDALIHTLNNDERMRTLLAPILEMIYQFPISNIGKLMPKIGLDHITNAVVYLLRSFIKHFGGQVIAALDVKNMVENQINRLELLQVEEIVLSVMNNQLQSITRFGLLLGALLGLFMPYLNNWLSTL